MTAPLESGRPAGIFIVLPPALEGAGERVIEGVFLLRLAIAAEEPRPAVLAVHEPGPVASPEILFGSSRGVMVPADDAPQEHVAGEHVGADGEDAAPREGLVIGVGPPPSVEGPRSCPDSDSATAAGR
jgi:hypothetical protein